jgi:hypothetical protein
MSTAAARKKDLEFYFEMMILCVDVLGSRSHLQALDACCQLNCSAVIFKDSAPHVWFDAFSITPLSCNLSINMIKGSTSIIACEIAIYSLSVVKSATLL